MKRGFTLIEIILSIGLIVLVGTISIVSFNLIKKHNKTTTLEKMSDEILTAVNVYIETNNEVKNKLYKNNNGLKIPLATLESSGLIDFQDIDLDEEDFVVTMLGSEDPNDDTCANTYTAKSWNITSGETIYICEKNNGSNTIMITGDTTNQNVLNKERNYIYADSSHLLYNDKKYHIFYVDKDDSLVLLTSAKTGGFGNDFDGVTQNIDGHINLEYLADNSRASCYDNYIILSYTVGGYYGNGILNDEVYIDTEDLNLLKQNGYMHCSGNAYLKRSLEVFITNGTFQVSTSFSSNYDGHVELINALKNIKKIKLKPCMKITSGVGDRANPYILENKC